MSFPNSRIPCWIFFFFFCHLVCILIGKEGSLSGTSGWTQQRLLRSPFWSQPSLIVLMSLNEIVYTEEKEGRLEFTGENTQLLASVITFDPHRHPPRVCQV